jgi:hypothetical protein
VATLQLGRRIDPATGDPGPDPLALDSAELTTHGVIVGMTGSGKTGLAVVLLEEVLAAGIPALILDPKGDMGNLLLTFPELAPGDFAPWIDAEAARREGITPAALAERTATRWREGLAAQGIGPERIRALRDAADVALFTPGSAAGRPLDVIGSLAAPPLSWDVEAEALRDEIEGIVASLLGLVGVVSDPLAGRESVLLANLIEAARRAGRDLDLATLIGEVQTPPVRKLGVFDVDVFFPPADRTALALRLNGLLASPAFAGWTAGEPLDIGALLRAPDGRPRAAIVSLAHLSDPERRFVTTLVLARLVTWMRGQPGTSELRALVYMDEVAGYAPPTATPPTKQPILTVLKQARAFGVGMVLATQNPVDLDYKAMANAGTWMVGRLQTENDKARVLEGLRSAAGGTDVAALDAAIGGLAQRRFLLVRARDPAPVVFASRWAMSYLRGPLTPDEAATLARAGSTAAPAEAPAAAAPPVADPDATSVPPTVASGVPVLHLDPAAPWSARVGAVAGGPRLRAHVAARVRVLFDDAAAELHEVQQHEAVYGPLEDALDLDAGIAVDFDDRDLEAPAPAGAAYVLPRAPIATAGFWRDAERAIARRLVESLALELPRNRRLGLVGRPGEAPDAFATRCAAAADARADVETARIRDRLEARQDRLAAALATARERVAELSAEERARQSDELVAGAGAVLGALLGGRRSTRSIATAMGRAASGRGAASRSAARMRTAEAREARAAAALAEIEQEILDEVAEIDARWQGVAAGVDTIAIRLEAGDVRVERLALLWVPTAA